MKTAVIRGVPLAMQRDGWWLGGIERRAPSTPGRRFDTWRRAGALIALIALADVLMWQTFPGLSLAVLGAGIAGAAIWCTGLRGRPAALAGLATGFVLLPLVELVQPLSVLIAVVGLSAIMVGVAGVRKGIVPWAVLRLWVFGPAQAVVDGFNAARNIPGPRGVEADFVQLVRAWAIPLGLGGVFVMLILSANPVLDQWAQNIDRVNLDNLDIGRMVFWGFMALMIWPCLILARLAVRLHPRAPRPTVQRAGLINAASVARSLVLFNVVFAFQTGTDALMLFLGAGLPEGMTYATYAHRGAYPLLVTALLAGAFAVAARRFTDDVPALRALLFIWLLQTLALVVASVVRLDIYVDAYGLTRLRMAAFVWMGVVATGLMVVIWQVQHRHGTDWMLKRNTILGMAVLYACCFVSFDAHVAQHNLTAARAPDSFYLCQLSEDALPAIKAYDARHRTRLCGNSYYGEPELFQPEDWREWGFRNARVRRSLAANQSTRVIQ